MIWPSSKMTRLKRSLDQTECDLVDLTISYVVTIISYERNPPLPAFAILLLTISPSCLAFAWKRRTLRSGAHLFTSATQDSKTDNGQMTREGPVRFSVSFKWQIREIVWRVLPCGQMILDDIGICKRKSVLVWLEMYCNNYCRQIPCTYQPHLIS